MNNERALYRIGAVGLMLGGLLAVADEALHPRSAEGIAELEARLRLIADSGIWVGVHTGLLTAVVLITGGLLALSRAVEGDAGRAWARLGAGAALASAAVFAVQVAVDAVARKQAALAWLHAFGEDAAASLRIAATVEALNYGLGLIYIVLFFGLTFLLFGLAVVLGQGFPRWLGWVAIPGGLVGLWTGLHQLYSGPSYAVTAGVQTVVALVLCAWLVVMGALLWVKASRPARPAWWQ